MHTSPVKKNFRATATYNLYRAFVPAVALLITLFLTHSIVLLVVVYFVAHTAVTTFLYIRTSAHILPTATTDSSAYTYGKHLSVINILTSLSVQIDKILIFHFVGALELAVYYFATNVPEQIKGVFKNIYTLALPQFVKRPIKDIRKSLLRKMFLFAIALGLTAFAYAIFAPFLYRFFFPEYTDAIALSQVLAFTLLASINIIPASVLQAKGAVRQLYMTQAVGMLIRIVLVTALVIPYGVWGVVFAVLIGKYIDVAVVTITALRLKNTSQEQAI